MNIFEKKFAKGLWDGLTIIGSGKKKKLQQSFLIRSGYKFGLQHDQQTFSEISKSIENNPVTQIKNLDG